MKLVQVRRTKNRRELLKRTCRRSNQLTIGGTEVMPKVLDASVDVTAVTKQMSQLQAVFLTSANSAYPGRTTTVTRRRPKTFDL